MPAMRKTSVYLADQEAEGLRRAALAQDRSQADLIRDGIRTIIEEADAQPREFRSMGRGRGGGRPSTRWSADELYQRRVGGS